MRKSKRARESKRERERKRESRRESVRERDIVMESQREREREREMAPKNRLLSQCAFLMPKSVKKCQTNDLIFVAVKVYLATRH